MFFRYIINSNMEINNKQCRRTSCKKRKFEDVEKKINNVVENPKRPLYLLNRPILELPKYQLPTNGDILRRYCHYFLKAVKV